jgi:hypothetical protein
MSMSKNEGVGFPPAEVRAVLRVEGLAVLAGAVAAYYASGASWWLFAALFLVPDVSMVAALGGSVLGSRFYNAMHSYTAPALLAAAGWLLGIGWMLPVALVWVAHIGMDRALGYGLKFPGRFDLTHLGAIGKAKAGRDPAGAGPARTAAEADIAGAKAGAAFAGGSAASEGRGFAALPAAGPAPAVAGRG